MDFTLDEDQGALLAAVQAMVARHQDVPAADRLRTHYVDVALQEELVQGGFLEAARELGPLGAALVVLEVAKAPGVVEAGVSALVAPHLLPGEELAGPIAIVDGDRLGHAHRNLSIARTALVDLGNEVAVLPVGEHAVEAVESVYAYPFGRFAAPPCLAQARRLPGGSAKLRAWRRVAMAAEFAGAADAALAFTIDYVKQRKVFGHAVGQFQAVQHRLAEAHRIVQGVRWLALRAAWSGEAEHADWASTYAQQYAKRMVFDFHQFNGAMGVTLEHRLHLWTYRLRALESEAGGVRHAALDIADRRWGAPSRSAREPVLASASGDR